MAIVKDLTSKRFGRLVAVECVGRTTNGNAKWRCKCDCGGEKVVASWGLISGNTKSCGCIKKEQNKQMWTTHGESRGKRTRLYGIWSGIKTRCYNPNEEWAYSKYGARGVTMCDEWKNSYEAFRDWAHSHGYRDDLTIDRIDFYGNYEPENCRWITQKEQARNTRNNRRITFCGITKTMAEWAELTNLTYRCLEHRMNRGWSVEDALQTPQRVVANGHVKYVETNVMEVVKNSQLA